MSDRQLIADLLSALEYHTEQTRPIDFSKVAIEAAREYLRQPAQQEPVACECHRCIDEKGLNVNGLPLSMTKMILCPECGNKRCPKASDHRLACTNSNEPGQPGSIYTSPPAQQEPVGMVKDLFTNAAWDKLDVVGSTKVYLGAAPQTAQQEPVAVTYKEVWDAMNALYTGDLKQIQIAIEMGEKKLYTSPPAQRTWVDLTDEELREFDVDPIEAKLMIAKLKEKNNG